MACRRDFVVDLMCAKDEDGLMSASSILASSSSRRSAEGRGAFWGSVSGGGREAGLVGGGFGVPARLCVVPLIWWERVSKAVSSRMDGWGH